MSINEVRARLHEIAYRDSAVKVMVSAEDLRALLATGPAFVTGGDPTWRHGTKSYTVTVADGTMQVMVMDGARIEFIGEAVQIESTSATELVVPDNIQQAYDKCKLFPESKWPGFRPDDGFMALIEIRNWVETLINSRP